MYDNLDFKLKLADAGNIDFLAETPCYFDVSGEHLFNGESVVTGSLSGLRISVNRLGVNVSDGSLCKWHLGDNFQTMGRSDTRQAVEKLSDLLHLPMDRATVTRADVAQNFIVRYPPGVYFNHLGTSYPAKRLEQPDGLYYVGANGLLIFYNKLKEQQAKGQPIPELYQNRNTLRYEQRFKSRLSKTFKVERVTGSMLYDEAFYSGIIDRWKTAYLSINKINDITLNFNMMNSKRDLYSLGVLSLVERTGGELAIIQQVTEAQKKGELTKKQAFDIKQAITEACKQNVGLTAQSDLIAELNQKVSEAVKFYR